MSTKALEVKRRIRTILSSLPTMLQDDVQVGFGLPARVLDKRYAFVGETRWESSAWATNRGRTEDFAVTVGFSVQLQGSTAEDAEDYVIRLAAEFEDELSSDPSLTGLCVSTTYTPKRVNSWPIDGAHEAQFEAEVSATARP